MKAALDAHEDKLINHDITTCDDIFCTICYDDEIEYKKQDKEDRAYLIEIGEEF